MARVLVVEDEPQLRRLVSDYLVAAGFGVVTAHDGAAGLAAVRAGGVDLVLLDLGLPGVDGLDVAREIRRQGELPLIMVTARADESDRLVGLELGADDYVTKPFSPKELVARVRAVLRRGVNRSLKADRIVAGEVELDVDRMRVTVAGRPVEHLTPTEFRLLLTLARQPGRVFTRSQLLDAVRGVAFESYERAVDAHVKNIRRKIEPDPRQPRYLLTVFGVGYRMVDVE